MPKRLIEIDAQSREVKDELFRASFMLAPVGITLVLPDQRILAVNPKTCEMFGYVEDEIVGQPISKYWHPDDNEPGSSFATAAQGGLKSYVNERRMVRKDGGTLWMRVTVSVIHDEKGSVAYLLSILEDVTARHEIEQERHRQEERLRGFFMSAPAIVSFLKGPDLVFEFVNQVFQERSGWRNVIGKTLLQAYPEFEGQNKEVERLTRVYQTGVPYHSTETPTQVRTRNGVLEDRNYDVSILPIFDAHGKPEGIMSFALDVTERVLARKKLEDARAAAQKALQAREDFLSAASHELRTPLTSVQMELQMLQRIAEISPDRPMGSLEMKRGLETAIGQVRRATDWVERLLDYTRIENDRFQIHPEPLDVAELVREVVESYRPQAAALGVSLVLACPQKLEMTVDAFRFEQVLINLLSNACKFGATRPVLIKLATEGEEVLLEVKDQGIGISAANQAKIFERFGRAVNLREFDGLGLGLFISRQIVEAHRGRIWVESEPGSGATFKVALPLRGGGNE